MVYCLSPQKDCPKSLLGAAWVAILVPLWFLLPIIFSLLSPSLDFPASFCLSFLLDLPLVRTETCVVPQGACLELFETRSRPRCPCSWDTQIKTFRRTLFAKELTCGRLDIELHFLFRLSNLKGSQDGKRAYKPATTLPRAFTFQIIQGKLCIPRGLHHNLA